MKILVGTDGSESSENAIAFASKLALRMDASLLIAHVTPVLPSTKEEFITLIKEEIGSPEKAGRKYLKRGREIAEKVGVKARTKLLEGSPAEELLREAEKGYEMLVVGSHGRGKVHEFILGSVTSKIVHLSRVPVLVAR
jgi:nucleotide-binding universal stress UspA family protein